MPDIDKRVDAFSRLGALLSLLNEDEKINTVANPLLRDKLQALNRLTSTLQQQNGWFSPAFVKNALVSLGESLHKEKLEKWISAYGKEIKKVSRPKKVAVIMAGNVPAVGFHDFLSVLISGHHLLAKLSSDDNKLIPAVAELLVAIEPEFEKHIHFTTELLKNFEVVIATGSNNSSRYFEYYFGKYPNIIRKNRNGVAVLTGRETEEELGKLADDIFLYYGLGCRSIAKLFVPMGYDFNPLFDVLSTRTEVNDNTKYFNNYEYNKAIYLVNSTPHFDTGNLLLTQNSSFSSPVSVLYYDYYQTRESLKNILMVNHDRIQCVVTGASFINRKIGFGKSQLPELWDYADGVDTLKFLLNLD